MCKNNHILIGLSSLTAITFIACNKPKKEQVEAISAVEKVYPLLDTENSRWFFFSSASRLFGMVNLSPDTEVNGAWGSGYRYKVDTVKGFSHIHAWQMSGLSVMPLLGSNENVIFKDFFSSFKHDKEIISPGYHYLELEKYNIIAELTSTKRVGFHKYTYSKGAKNRSVLFNLNMILGPNENVNGILIKDSDIALSGSFVMSPTMRRPKPLTTYFKIIFNSPITSIKQDDVTKNYLVSLNDTESPVLMKVGISYISVENASNNIDVELSYWEFNKIVNDSKSKFNTQLSRIKVQGGTINDQKRFYTDLWHALQSRRIISDVNGAYPDNTGKEFRIGQLPINAQGHPKFNHFNSDSFRGAQWTINALWGLVYPEVMHEFSQSLLQYYKDGGQVPRGPSGGNYTYIMTGASSTPFIVSVIQKGIVTKNLDTIYEALKKNHVLGGIMGKAGYEHDTDLGGGLHYFLSQGYVPYPLPEGKYGIHLDGSGQTLEYAYQDFTLAQLAKKLGKIEDQHYFENRSQNYKNVYNTKNGWMQSKNIQGNWSEDFDPYLYKNGFVESNAAQSTWFVPHDL